MSGRRPQHESEAAQNCHCAATAEVGGERAGGEGGAERLEGRGGGARADSPRRGAREALRAAAAGSRLFASPPPHQAGVAAGVLTQRDVTKGAGRAEGPAGARACSSVAVWDAGRAVFCLRSRFAVTTRSFPEPGTGWARARVSERDSGQKCPLTAFFFPFYPKNGAVSTLAVLSPGWERGWFAEWFAFFSLELVSPFFLPFFFF